MKERFLKIWKDPVGSNVIASIIFALILTITGAGFKIIKGLYNEIPLSAILRSIWETATQRTEVPVWIVLIFMGICLTTAYQIGRKIYDEFKKKEQKVEAEQKEPPIFHYGNGIHFFANRIGYAFPGLRDKLEWYKGKDAVNRLARFLSEPLVFSTLDREGLIKPIWWYRAGSSMFIESFEILSKTKCLMNNDELIIDKIAVYHSQFEFRNFIYVEVLPDKPSGAYTHTSGYIAERVKEYGYYWEEFGLANGVAIKREEYEDGAATIKGKVVDTHGAQLRTRCLTKYNLLITSTSSPYNSHKFDRDSGEYLNGILKGDKTFQDFFNFLMTFERNERFVK